MTTPLYECATCCRTFTPDAPQPGARIVCPHCGAHVPGESAKHTKLSVDRHKEVSEMATKRKVEVFSAGCPCCTEVVALVHNLSCASCDVEVLDMHDPVVAQRARALGVHSVPAVAIDGQLADCCAGRAVDEHALRAAGLGQP